MKDITNIRSEFKKASQILFDDHASALRQHADAVQDDIVKSANTCVSLKYLSRLLAKQNN